MGMICHTTKARRDDLLATRTMLNGVGRRTEVEISRGCINGRKGERIKKEFFFFVRGSKGRYAPTDAGRRSRKLGDRERDNNNITACGLLCKKIVALESRNREGSTVDTHQRAARSTFVFGKSDSELRRAVDMDNGHEEGDQNQGEIMEDSKSEITFLLFSAGYTNVCHL